MTTMNTLQNLCLDKIISDFSRYYQAYCSTEDLSLKREFEFLKKKFSFRIVQKLNEEYNLKTEYLDFLINKYLKVLDTRWLKDWSWETVSQKLAEIGPNLEEITFSDRPWEEILCYLPNLRKVFFQEHCSDEFLVNLSKFCGCIEILDVRKSKRVSDSGLVNLCCIPGKNPSYAHLPIKELFIKNTRVGDEGVAYVLKNMPNLQNIDYWNLSRVLYSIHKSDTNAFDKIKPYNFTHLEFTTPAQNNIFTDILSLCFSVCPHIKSLCSIILEKSNLDLCSQLQELEKLRLECKEPLELNKLLTLNWKKLTSLDISNFSISLSVLAENCPHLKLLRMDQVNLQHNVNDFVPVFHNLEKVDILNFTWIEPVISQAVTCLLSSAPNLNWLKFVGLQQGCEIFSADIKTQILRCCEQCKLNNINFICLDIEYELLRDVILTCPTLKKLIFYGRDIARDREAVIKLKRIAASLPNKPRISFHGL